MQPRTDLAASRISFSLVAPTPLAPGALARGACLQSSGGRWLSVLVVFVSGGGTTNHAGRHTDRQAGQEAAQLGLGTASSLPPEHARYFTPMLQPCTKAPTLASSSLSLLWGRLLFAGFDGLDAGGRTSCGTNARTVACVCVCVITIVFVVGGGRGGG
jgi:hypothetical protein